MNNNDQIVQAAWSAVFGKIPGVPQAPGFCLQAVRVIVEHALDWPSHDLYKRCLVASTSRRPGDAGEQLRAAKQDPWAADLEASAKALGWPVPGKDRQPGDLVFNHAAAIPYGHVGILLTPDVVLENVNAAFRPASIEVQPNLCLTPYHQVPWTLVARIPSFDE